MRMGPINFSPHDSPGVLVEGADCPPVLMEAHTPPYYLEFLERYGMEKQGDLFAWRAFRSQIGEGLSKIPAELLDVAEMARRFAGVTIRKVRMEDWDAEIAAAHHLFNATLSHLPEHIPTSEAEFSRLGDQIRPFVNPDLAFFAEAEGEPVAFLVALPDLNRALVHLDGRLFPFGCHHHSRTC